MTTEGEIIPMQRDLDVLLLMDTYQGMTDAEIQSIIDYRCGVAASEAASATRRDAQFVAQERLIDATVDKIQAATDVLQSMLDTEIPWVRVGGDS